MKKLAHPIWKFRYLLLALAAFWAVQAISQEPTPNLSGIWRWNPDKSQVGGPPATNRRVKIEQQGSDLTMTTRIAYEAGEEFHKSHYIIGSDDNTNELMGSPLKSKVQWKDGTLAVESVATMGPGELHLSDTWTVSPDGKTLTFHESRVMGDRPPNEDTIVYEKQPQADWEPPQPPKLAEEVYKNIQIFKGMPAPELLNAMRSFTRSLGVQCDFCHVMGAFDKDDKPEKPTAREMILMARQINKDNFGGHMRVTCWTCHRGSTEPESAAK
ncbi:MAG TPA: c-type cytochrome [Terriglobia bacterium]|nr:c-type cytochrome [Terriglobia bacterium]